MNKDLQNLICWQRDLLQVSPSLLRKPLTKLESYKLRYILDSVNWECYILEANKEYYDTKEDKIIYRNAKRYKKRIEYILKLREV